MNHDAKAPGGRHAVALRQRPCGVVALGRALLVALALVAGGGGWSFAWAQNQDKPPADAWVQSEEMVKNALGVGDFAEVERLFFEARRPGARLSSGHSALGPVRSAIAEIIHRKGRALGYAAEVEALTLQWARQRPDSALAQVLHVEALLAKAWWYRGQGYAHTVPDEAFAQFRRGVQAAQDYLEAHADTALRDTLGHYVMISVGRLTEWPLAKQWATAQRGLALNPDDDDLYFNMLFSTLPKWGGSPQAVDYLVKQAVERTRAARGLEMYARLYVEAADQQFGASLFQDSHADWRTMRQGFLDMVSRNDSAHRRNSFAYFACLARDKDTFLEQMEKVGEAIKPERWGTNPRATMLSCRRWAGGA